MREIKFRAWDAKRNMMFDVQTGFLPKGVTAKRNFCIGFNSTGLEVSEYEGKGYWRRFPAMQYTGLKDKNGVEIYEGDIVRVDDDWEKYGFASGITGPVVFTDSAKFAINDRIGSFNFESDSHRYVEIVGNIYENADLLK